MVGNGNGNIAVNGSIFTPMAPWARIMSTTGIGIACMLLLHTYCSSAAAATATAAAAAAALGIVASLSVQF